MDDMCQIKVELNDSILTEVDPLALPTEITHNKTTKRKTHSTKEPEYALVKFIHVADLSKVTKYVEKKIAAWKQQDTLIINPTHASNELKACQRKYDKRIQGLYVLIKDIVKVATKEMTVAKSLGKKDTRFSEQQVASVDQCSSKTKDMSPKAFELALENKNLKEKLKDALKKKLQAENNLNIMNKQLLTKQKENKTIRHLLRVTRDDRDEILNNLSNFKTKLAGEEKKSGELKIKCAALATELDKFKKERTDSDVIDTWFNYTLKYQQVIKEQLAKLNEDVQGMRRLVGSVPETTRTDVEVTPHREKKKKHFHAGEREQWLEEQDSLSREIEWEFCVLRENLSLLKYDLGQTTEQVDFPEIETVVVEEETGVCIKEECVEVIKVEELSEDEVL